MKKSKTKWLGESYLQHQKFFRVMKLTLILAFAGLVTFASSSFSQNSRLSMNLEQVTILDIFEAIEQQTDYQIAYNSNSLDVQRKINLKVDNRTVNEVLDMILEPSILKYEFIGHYIIIADKNAGGNTFYQMQQSKAKVSGKVTNTEGEPIPGVTVLIKGSTSGTISSADGSYLLSDVPSNAILIFSFVGMRTVEIDVDRRDVINVRLEEEAIGIEEVVAIGYGTIKKVNLTGSVASIGNEELTKRPVNNVTNLLQGKMTGLTVNQGSGQPGKENSFMRIRGAGTFSGAGNDPLVIIDGISGSLDALDPENIESVSVLKDAASAAIYGARAANGVIVVTTRKGSSGTVDIFYHGSYAVQSATVVPDFIYNSAEYMEMWNSAHKRQGIANLFDQSVIDAYRNAGPNNPSYPNFNWVDHCINPAPVHRHNLSASGGNEKVHFYANLGYFDQEGVVIGHDYKKYTGQINVDAKINNRITFGADVSLAVGKRKEPWLYDTDFILLIYGSQPMYPPYMPDGVRYTHGGWADKWVNRNPVAVANEGGRYLDSQTVRAISYLKVDILPELTWQIKGSVQYDHSFHKTHQYPVDCYYFATDTYSSDMWPSQLGVQDQFSTNTMPTFYSTLDYKETFLENHHLTALAGYNQEYFKNRYLTGYRRDYNFPELGEIDAGGTDGQSTTGTAYEWAIQSLFGRVSYDYKEKYLFEANIRYDGTSRISKENRWGVFPSFSAGWRLSEEKFMGTFQWIDNLKLRGSWGQLGNQNIGAYPYQDVLSLTAYPAGETLEQGVIQSRLTDKTLEWETTTIMDAGLDMSLANGLFSMVFDWYKKDTDGILSSASIPASVGLSAPTINYGSMENKGIELLLEHKNKIDELTYSVGINYSVNRNKVTKIKAPSYGLNSYVVGKPYGSYYMIEWDGIFQSPEEIEAAPVHQYSPQPGDLRFKDAKKDGKINSEDRVFVDGIFPDFTYGGNIDLQWKNWDMSLFFQGVEGQKYYVTWWAAWPFTQGTPPTTDWRNAWTAQQPSKTMPALWSFSTYGYGPMSGTENTYYLQDASYVRLKNMQIGYNLPKDICSKVGFKDARVYFSADNLFTITKFKNSDPERYGLDDSYLRTRGSVYPQVKTVSLGVKVKL